MVFVIGGVDCGEVMFEWIRWSIASSWFMLHACFLRAFQSNGECSKCHDNVKGLPWTRQVKSTKQHKIRRLSCLLACNPVHVRENNLANSLLLLSLYLGVTFVCLWIVQFPCTKQKFTRACAPMAVFCRTPDEQVHNQPETIPQGGPGKHNLPPCSPRWHLLHLQIACCYILLYNFKVDTEDV